MSWPFIVGALIILAVIGMVVLDAFRQPNETVYVVMWNDAVVGVTRDQQEAQRFCDHNTWPEGGHHVRWLPFALGANPQVFAHERNNWGRQLSRARSYPL